MTFNDYLPVIFMGLMGLSMLIYVSLDGYDLGLGMLLPFASHSEKNMMMTSIAPFWDANETWLVLGIGLLLVACLVYWLIGWLVWLLGYYGD